MADLLNIDNSSEFAVKRYLAPTPSLESLGPRNSASAFSVPITRDNPSKKRLINNADLGAVKGAGFCKIRGHKNLIFFSLVENPRIVPREGSTHTDISSDLGDLRIQINYDGKFAQLRKITVV
jgi:hypothetical protein